MVVLALQSAGPAEVERPSDATVVPSETTAEDLPPPADGYAWYMSPAHKFGGESYHRFAVQIPADWTDLGHLDPVGSNISGSRLIRRFGQQGREDVVVTTYQELGIEAGRQSWPMDWTLSSTGSEACKPAPAGEYSPNALKWERYEFSCVVQQFDERKRQLPAITLQGYVAETRAGELLVRIVAFKPKGEADVKPILEQATSSFVLLQVIQPVIAAATPAAAPPSLPAPAEGYVWYSTPPDYQHAFVRYAVQVPVQLVGPAGPYFGNPISFVPRDIEAGTAYKSVPQLITKETPAGSGFEHPFLWEIGRQGGGGCSSGESGEPGTQIIPSGQYAGGGYSWDVYFFTCSVRTTSDPVGVTYDARAAETVIGPYIFSIIAIEPPDSGAMGAAFEQAMASFTVTTPLPALPAPVGDPAPLGTATAGYVWHVQNLRALGLPDYAVQVPVGWPPGDPEFNPKRFGGGTGGHTLYVQVMPAGVVLGHAFLEFFETCAQLEPSYKSAGEAVTWDVYSFGCDTSRSGEERSGELYEAIVAEAWVGDYVVSVIVEGPPGSDSGKPAFEQAIATFRLQ